eukprot:scaffold403922_cov31-Attheya_sp.AAC.1
MIGKLSVADDQPESIMRTIRKLEGLCSKLDENGELDSIVCPCCSREMGPSELDIFQKNLLHLSDPEESPIMQSNKSRAEKNRTAVANYE